MMEWHAWGGPLLGFLVLAVACQSEHTEAQASVASARVASARAKLSEPIAPRPIPSGKKSRELDSQGRPFTIHPQDPHQAHLTEVEVRLLDAGKKPRRTLRYSLKKGQKDRARVEVKTHFVTSVSRGATQSPPSPDLEFTLGFEIVELLGEGKARRQLEVQGARVVSAGPEVTTEVRREVEGSLELIRSFSGHDEIDERGLARNLQLEGGNSVEHRAALEAMHQAFGQIAAPLPQEAVGIGGRWEVTTEVIQLGVELTEKAVFELIEFEDGLGRTKVRVEQRVPAGDIDARNLPLGLQAEVVEMRSAGEGSMTFELTRLVPSGQVETVSHVVMNTRSLGVKQRVTTDTTTNLRFEAVGE